MRLFRVSSKAEARQTQLVAPAHIFGSKGYAEC
jgi:hypothetical protein